MKEYNVTIFNTKEKKTRQVLYNEDELKEYINDFIKETNIAISIIPQPSSIGKKEYYKKQYEKYYSQFKKNKINEDTYRGILKTLKKLNNECGDRTEMEKNFEEYKKANNIPPYIVSQK